MSINRFPEDRYACRPPYLSDSPIFSGCLFAGGNEQKERNGRCRSAKEEEQTDNSRLTHSGRVGVCGGYGRWLNTELIPLGRRIGGIGSFVRRDQNRGCEGTEHLSYAI